MKKFRTLVREGRVEDEGPPSVAAATLKDKPNKEPMPKLKEQNDTTEKVEMTQSQLHFIAYACEEILDFIDDGGEVEEWYQVKVAKSFSEFESLHSFIEGEKRRTGMVKEEQLNELDKEPGGTLHRYLAKAGGPEGRQRRIQAAMDNPSKLKKINTGIKSAETKIEKERQKQTGMNPQYQRTPTAREIQKMDLRYTHEEYESMPASKALQDRHQREREKRGLPDPSYYLKLAAQKKKEIEDMKKEEVEINELKISTLTRYGTKATQSLGRDSSKTDKRIVGINRARAKVQKQASMKKEEVELLDEKNKPTNPELWSRAVSMAKSKFDVYPSAYANGWAAKWYKEKGGGWKSVSEETELKEGYYKSQETERQETERLAKRNDPPFTPDKPKKPSVVVGKKPEGYSVARHLARQAMKKQVEKMNKPIKEAEERGTEPFLKTSRKAEIVKGAAKKGQKADKFESEPVLSSTVTRNN